MSISIEIQPTADCVAMVGDITTFTSYSLSGNVLVKFEKSLVRSLLPTTQPLYYTVASLDIYFEGHQDVLDRSGALASTAICRIHKPLIPSGSLPVVLSPIVHTIGIPFELSIPSWLPPTWMGSDGLTSYSLFCKAKVVPHHAPGEFLTPYKPSSVELGNIYPLADESRSLKRAKSLWCLSRPSSAPAKPSSKQVEAKPVSIAVGRFRTPPPTTTYHFPAVEGRSLFPHTYYILEPKLRTSPESLADEMQVRLFNSIVLHVGVPSFVGVQETKVPVYCAIKSNMEKELLERTEFEVVKVSFNIQQVEAYQTPIDLEYEANHPLPPAEEQPPRKPLMAQNIFTSLGACGLLAKSVRDSKWERHNELSKHDVTHSFDHPLAAGHCKTRLEIPLVQEEKGKEPVTIWPDMESPYCKLHHCIYMSIDCRYVDEAGEVHTENMAGVVPLRFTAVALDRSSSPSSPSFMVQSMDCPKPKVSKQGSTTNNTLPPVPAYAQIFDENGEIRMVDPLPKYEPKRSNSGRSGSTRSTSTRSTGSGSTSSWSSTASSELDLDETPASSYARSVRTCRTASSVRSQPKRHQPMAIAF